MKTFKIFYLHSKTIRQSLYQKKSSHRSSFGKYIDSFLPSFSIDDTEKFDLYANKNSKYLFYQFHDYVKAYGKEKTKNQAYQENWRFDLPAKIEKGDQKLLIEKIIHPVEFKNRYENSIEKKPEIIDTFESNYRVIRRVYQRLYSDIADIFFECVHSLDPDEIQELDE